MKFGLAPLRGWGAAGGVGVGQRLVEGVTLRLSEGGVGHGRIGGGELTDEGEAGKLRETLLAQGLRLLVVGVMDRLAEEEDEAVLGEGVERGQSQARSSWKLATDMVWWRKGCLFVELFGEVDQPGRKGDACMVGEDHES